VRQALKAILTATPEEIPTLDGAMKQKLHPYVFHTGSLPPSLMAHHNIQHDFGDHIGVYSQGTGQEVPSKQLDDDDNQWC